MKKTQELKDIQLFAKRLRQDVLRMIYAGKSSHIGTNFSMVELLAVLYSGILKVRPDQPDWPERDRFILSKGHGCASLYATLARTGFFPSEWLDDYYQNGSRLTGHATHHGIPGVEVSTGALGHGLALACGMALSAKRDEQSHRIVTLLSDGECDEGSTWEAILFAGHHALENLTVIIDYNKIQSLGRVEDVLSLEPFADKWHAFGWGVTEIDGHNMEQIQNAFQNLPYKKGQPNCIIAHTVKGKGVSFMEDDLLWHYRCPDDEEYARALKELEGAK